MQGSPRHIADVTQIIRGVARPLLPQLTMKPHVTQAPWASASPLESRVMGSRREALKGLEATRPRLFVPYRCTRRGQRSCSRETQVSSLDATIRLRSALLSFMFAKAHLIARSRLAPLPAFSSDFGYNSHVGSRFRFSDSGSANQRFESSLPNRSEQIRPFRVWRRA